MRKSDDCNMYELLKGFEFDNVASCYDCDLLYDDATGFADLVVMDHSIWNNHLSPTGNEGGLLCPNCMCKRAYNLGLTNVQVQFMSGSFSMSEEYVQIKKETLGALVDFFILHNNHAKAMNDNFERFDAAYIDIRNIWTNTNPESQPTPAPADKPLRY